MIISNDNYIKIEISLQLIYILYLSYEILCV